MTSVDHIRFFEPKYLPRERRSCLPQYQPQTSAGRTAPTLEQLLQAAPYVPKKSATRLSCMI